MVSVNVNWARINDELGLRNIPDLAAEAQPGMTKNNPSVLSYEAITMINTINELSLAEKCGILKVIARDMIVTKHKIQVNMKSVWVLTSNIIKNNG